MRPRFVRVVGDPFPIRGKPGLVFVGRRVRNRDRLSLAKELEDGDRAGADRALQHVAPVRQIPPIRRKILRPFVVRRGQERSFDTDAARRSSRRCRDCQSAPTQRRFAFRPGTTRRCHSGLSAGSKVNLIGMPRSQSINQMSVRALSRFRWATAICAPSRDKSKFVV